MGSRARSPASSQPIPEPEEKGVIQIRGLVKYHGKTCFAVHFDGNQKVVLVDPKEMKEKFPREVIKFYESCVVFVERNQIPVKSPKKRKI